MTEILTPKSRRWNEFRDALYVTLDAGWHCDCRRHRGQDCEPRYAKRVMQNMGRVDIEGSLAYFEHRGGHCDCQILFSVDDTANVH